MAHSHGIDGQLPSSWNIWSCVSSSGTEPEGQCYLNVDDPTIASEQVPEAFASYCNGAFSVSSEPSTNVNFQQRPSNFEPYHHTNPSQTPIFNQLRNTTNGLTFNVDFSNAKNPSETLNHGYRQRFLGLPTSGLPHGHISSQEFQDPFQAADTIAMIPPNTIGVIDTMKHHDAISCNEEASNTSLSHMNFGCRGNELEINTSVPSYVDINPSLETNMGALMPEERLEPDQELYHSSPGTFSSQNRFLCHHPLCVGRTFSRRQDRDRHARVHDSVRDFLCPVEGCTKSFYRRDKLECHLEKGH
ncbi:hypothetical protein DM02DRAFT_629593 [Periconia macrospinosa]|uniref:C2H2-type domain-containing protein n=1 Tax=Periconia macrospinosa TaxID=97972 RepID=A0A2V1DLZ0_9PLEO|nr:hypothetical protein DM02DRAFT_629593 [Periconia macrospinosa]